MDLQDRHISVRQVDFMDELNPIVNSIPPTDELILCRTTKNPMNFSGGPICKNTHGV